MNLSKYGNGSSAADVGVAVCVRCLSGSGQKDVFNTGSSLEARAKKGEVGDWLKSGSDRLYLTHVRVRTRYPVAHIAVWRDGLELALGKRQVAYRIDRDRAGCGTFGTGRAGGG